MKKSLLITLILLLICMFTLSSCVGDFGLDLPFLDIKKNEESSDTAETSKSSKKPKYEDDEDDEEEEEEEETDEEEEDSIYSATEIYNQSVKYVGEIITYDKNGNASTLGTGFVISSDGEVLTNYHVIEGAYSADITINDKKYDVSTVLAYDEDIDLAVLKINAENLPCATLCKRSVNAGETVYAIGSSRGLTNTYSQGIVTYSNRIIDGVSCVQHDASITHGNSGGPLINVYGEVIGINTWGISDSQNLNFAVYIGELENLVYRTPYTLEELYKEPETPFDALVSFIVDNGQEDDEGSEFYIRQSSEEMTSIKYYSEDGEILLGSLVVTSEDVTFYTAIFLEKDADDYYYASYRRVDGEVTHMIAGYIESDTFTRNMTVGYNKYEGASYHRESIREIASEHVIYLIDCLGNTVADNLNLTVADFGFVSFS